MNNIIFPILGAGIAFSIISVFVKEQKKEYGILVSLAGSVILIYFSVQYIEPIFQFVKKISDYINFPFEWITILIKVLGVTLITQFACDICRDSGETALASKIELAGKIFIIVFALPLFEKLLSIITNNI